MSGKQNRKVNRALRRESAKVAPGLVMLINGARPWWRARLAIEILFGCAQLEHLVDVAGNVALQEPRAEAAAASVSRAR